MKFLCHLEAVNLANLFGDCHDLSTTRGGGLSVLNIGEEVPKAEVIVAGASQGLLVLEDASRRDAIGRIRAAIAVSLGQLEPYATVMVDAIEYEPENFVAQREYLKASIRAQQMQSPTVAYPPIGDQGICQVDSVRPAKRRPDMVIRDAEGTRQKNILSDFTYLRRNFGRKQKTQLLRKILRIPKEFPFETAEHLNDLVSDSPVSGNCRDKIAVLRFDGNNFGAISAQCSSRSEAEAFSSSTRRMQEEFFQNLLFPGGAFAPSWWTGPAARKLLLEVFVYGGDEVTIAIPAWLAFSAAQSFFRLAQAQPPVHGHTLTYSGGLVICHHNAPIHAVRDLAGNLAEEAKQRVYPQPKGAFLAYQILESFDHVGRDLKEFLDERFDFCGKSGILLCPQAIDLLISEMPLWRSKVSKRKLHSLIVNPPSKGISSEIASLVEDSRYKKAETLEQLANFRNLVGSDAAFLHLLELWDYVSPE